MPLILLPTRISNKTATLIDHMFYNEGSYAKSNLKVHSGNILSDISDHLPNFIILSNCVSKENINCRPYIRLHTPQNKIKFRESLSSVDWQSHLYSCSDVNTCFNEFISVLQNIYEKSFPLIRQSRKAYKDKKWITSGIKISSKRKDLLFKKWKLSNNLSDETLYRSYKKNYSAILKKAQILYYEKLFDSKSCNIKKLWANLNTLCSNSKKEKCNSSIDKLFDDNGAEIISPLDISNCFNNFFCNVGKNLVKQLPVSSKHFSDYCNKSFPNSIYVEDVTTYEILNLIASLKNNKSSGPDGINCRLLKENAYLFCEPLCYIYNLSLFSGVVPDRFKIAKVVPIYKKGATTQASNYRPISLLSIFNKLLEKLVYRRLYGFLNKHNVLYKYQFGFRKNYSSTLAILDVLDSCYKNLDNNNMIVGIYLDLQKAFDTVDHEILLSKLSYYGIRGVMLSWIKNYLYNRKQYTVANNVASDLGSITCGVPQGSVLGPLLFLLYMNDIKNSVPDNDIKLFADDTNVFIFGNSLTSLEYQANKCLKNLELWFNANKLSLSIDKTCYSVFTGNKRSLADATLNVVINGQQINKVSSCKYLGVFIDDALKWNVHIDYVYSKIIKFASFFYKLRSFVPKECLCKIYYAFVFPYINFGVEIYANCSNAALDKLIKLNNKLLRILLDKKYDTPNIELYRIINSLPIPLLHEMKLLEIVHKCYYHKHLLPEIFQNYFVTNNLVHHHHTRNKLNLHLSIVNSSCGQRSFSYSGSKYWNDIPSNFKIYCSTAEFKNHIKHYLMWR